MRNLLNEDTPGFWSDAKLNSYLNMAMQRVYSIISAIREDYFTVSATYSTVAGQKSYTLPLDCRYIRRMEIFDSSDDNFIIKLDELKWPRMESNGDWLFYQDAQPKRYVMIGQHFDLYPIPDGIYTIRMYYDARLNDMAADTDIPSVPVDFHDMIVFFACALAKKQNEEDDGGYIAFFNIRKAELIQLATRRGGDDPRAVEAYLEGII